MDHKGLLKFGSGSIQLSNELGTIMFIAGHVFTNHDPFFNHCLLLFQCISQFCILYIFLFKSEL